MTTESIADCKLSTRDLIYELAAEFGVLVGRIRAVRGDEAAEAFLQLIRNMDDAGRSLR